MVQVTLTSSSHLHSLAEFRNLIVKQVNGGIIRLSDVAQVTLGADSYEAAVRFDGNNGVFIGIQIAPSANLLNVIDGVKANIPEIRSQLPQGMAVLGGFHSPALLDGPLQERGGAPVDDVLFL